MSGAVKRVIRKVLLWLLGTVVAIGLGIAGIWQIFQGDFILGLVLVIVAFVVGPGGFSIWTVFKRKKKEPAPR